MCSLLGLSPVPSELLAVAMSSWRRVALGTGDSLSTSPGSPVLLHASISDQFGLGGTLKPTQSHPGTPSARPALRGQAKLAVSTRGGVVTAGHAWVVVASSKGWCGRRREQDELWLVFYH